MNEITRIHLGRQPFTIAIDAHTQLRAYLAAIKRAVGDAHVEVLKEIELRMAELLTERGITGDTVIVGDDVTFLKEQLGTPSDFGEESDPADDDTEQQTGHRRLFRNAEDGILGGVSGGLAAYFGIDTVIVRLLFVLATLLGGWGILLYILLWIIVPEAKTSSERLQMRGRAVTVDSLKGIVDKADVSASARRAGRGVSSILYKLVIIAVVSIGLGIAVTGFLILLSSILGAAYTALYQSSIFPVGDFNFSIRDMLFSGSVFTAAAVSGIALFLMGVATIRRKWAFPSWVAASLLGVFFATLTVGGALAPGFVDKVRTYADNATNTQTRSVGAYSDIHVTGSSAANLPITYEYIPDGQAKVTLEYIGSPTLTDIAASVKDGILTVNTERFRNDIDCRGLCIIDSYRLRIAIHGPVTPRAIQVNGLNTALHINGGLQQPTLSVQVAQDSSLSISRLTIDSATIATYAGTGSTLATLTGLQKSPVSSEVLYIASTVTLPRTAQLTLQTDRTCSDAFVGMPSQIIILPALPVRGITVNGHSVNTLEMLLQKQHEPSVNSFNCLYVNGV